VHCRQRLYNEMSDNSYALAVLSLDKEPAMLERYENGWVHRRFGRRDKNKILVQNHSRRLKA
jgi:hypothetical protein